MLLNETWVEVSTSATVLQKLGNYAVKLVYSAGSPSGPVDSSFTLPDNSPHYFPKVTGESLWAMAANSAGANISVKEVS